MARLFFAIDLPQFIRRQLAELLPERGQGVRPVAEQRLHLTIQFLGEFEVADVAACMSEFRFTSFTIQLANLGTFRQGRGRGVLWVGVEHSKTLVEFHATVTKRLAEAGLPHDDRPYTPHLTLARYDRRRAGEKIDKLVAAGRAFQSAPFTVQELVLYSSLFNPEGPQYACEVSWPGN